MVETMLAERDRELLTSYVDGELTARERRHVEQLLRRSESARRLLARLEADSRTLKAIPTPPLEIALSDLILQAIRDRGLEPSSVPRPATLPLRRPLPAWVGYTAAAAVLFAVGLGAF